MCRSVLVEHDVYLETWYACSFWARMSLLNSYGLSVVDQLQRVNDIPS